MSIKRVNKEELKDVATKLFGVIVADLREEAADLRAEVNRLMQSIVALHAQFTALENRARSEFRRSESSRKAILKRLAEVENKKGSKL